MSFSMKSLKLRRVSRGNLILAKASAESRIQQTTSEISRLTSMVNSELSKCSSSLTDEMREVTTLKVTHYLNELHRCREEMLELEKKVLVIETLIREKDKCVFLERTKAADKIMGKLTFRDVFSEQQKEVETKEMENLKVDMFLTSSSPDFCLPETVRSAVQSLCSEKLDSGTRRSVTLCLLSNNDVPSSGMRNL